MSLIPNTTCRRCHRQYPSFRSHCPYCGTKKVREVRSAVPETDSAVPGTQAAKSAAEAVNWQMLIGGVLLIAVFLVTVILVSVNVSNHVMEEPPPPITDGNGDGNEQTGGAVFTTAEPIVNTPEPSPSPTPAPAITDVRVTWDGNPTVSNYINDGFWSGVGYHYDMKLSFYPIDPNAVIEWKSEDESCVTVDNGSIDVIGGSGKVVNVTVSINGGKEYVIPIHIT